MQGHKSLPTGKYNQCADRDVMRRHHTTTESQVLLASTLDNKQHEYHDELRLLDLDLSLQAAAQEHIIM